MHIKTLLACFAGVVVSAAFALPAYAYEVVQAPQAISLPPHYSATLFAQCPLGESVISGGYDIDKNAGHLIVTASHPYTANSLLWSAWRVQVTAVGHVGTTYLATVNVYAVCQ